MNLPPIFDHPVVGLLAAVGAVGLVYRLGRTLLRLGIAAAEATAVGGLLETSIRNGDLTGMAENREVVQRARAGRLRAGALLLLWSALLILPPAFGVARAVYAVSALVWLLPRRPLRLRVPRAGPR